jgi:hypothetical protein
MFQAKFVMMSSIGHTSKFIFEPLMELIYQLKFLHQNKYYILVEKGLILKMLWLFVIFVCVSPLFGMDGNVFFWKLFEKRNCDFHTLLEVFI